MLTKHFQRIKHKAWWGLILVIFVVYALRMITTAQVGLEVDEPINYIASTSQQTLGFPAIREELGYDMKPYFSHPPFGYMLMAYWFDLTGAELHTARILSALVTTLALVTLAGFVKRTVGYSAGLFTLLLTGLDNWLIMTNGMFYLENFQLILLVIALWAYWKTLSLKQEHMPMYVLTGLLVGTVVIFKHIGVYFALGIATSWLALGKNHRGYLALFSSMLAVILVYCVGMYIKWGNLWWDPTWHQVQRTFGSVEARGLNYSLDTMINVIIDRYWIFAITILGMCLGTACTALLYVGYITKRLKLPYSTAIIVFWGMGAIIFGGGTALRSPHYFMLWLLPFWALLAIGLHKLYKKLPQLVTWILIIAIGLNLASFVWRIGVPHGDVVVESAQYVSEKISDDAVVATEPYIAALFQQKYIKYDQTSPRELLDMGVTHLVLYWTTTATIPKELGDTSYYCQTLSEEFSGFKDCAVVCQINQTLLDSLTNP
jgi:4-amino-4-deoxy-L-arabinose transferase-like glycosyltransferase